MTFTQFLSSLNCSTHTTRLSSHTIRHSENTTSGKSLLTRFRMRLISGRFSKYVSSLERL